MLKKSVLEMCLHTAEAFTSKEKKVSLVDHPMFVSVYIYPQILYTNKSSYRLLDHQSADFNSIPVLVYRLSVYPSPGDADVVWTHGQPCAAHCAGDSFRGTNWEHVNSR